MMPSCLPPPFLVPSVPSEKFSRIALPELEFLNNLWGLGPSKIRVVVPARQGYTLHWLAELVPWNRFLGPLKVKNAGSELSVHGSVYGSWRLVGMYLCGMPRL
jgi:hypothetical protein